MARIRSIKPEFFDSPSTAACSPWARLLYIAMWCIADDWGIGQANMKELAAFAFPNDDAWTSKELPSLCKEVADNYEVEFYTHRGRAYFAILGWDEHQVTQRRAKRRHPGPEDPESAPDLRFHDEQGTSEHKQGTSLSRLGNSRDGTGEQGNRGTGEQSSSSEVADATSRPEIDELLDYLDAAIEANGAKVPNRTKKNLDAARLLLDKDERTVEQVKAAIDFATSDEFWRTNILSMSKLREKYDTLQMRAAAQRNGRPTRPGQQKPASYPLPGTPEFAALSDDEKVRILEREQIREFNR